MRQVVVVVVVVVAQRQAQHPVLATSGLS